MAHPRKLPIGAKISKNLLRKPSYSQFCPKFCCHGNGGRSGKNAIGSIRWPIPEPPPPFYNATQHSMSRNRRLNFMYNVVSVIWSIFFFECLTVFCSLHARLNCQLVCRFSNAKHILIWYHTARIFVCCLGTDGSSKIARYNFLLQNLFYSKDYPRIKILVHCVLGNFYTI